ncbi:MAG: VRR-NUC domain-containing protein [Oligoflexia bacterium]|nr:VRR-NUC domain-containing protein [Oligoflexia bacterium]
MENSPEQIHRLARDYYLKNFQYLLRFCAKRYADLLTKKELKFIDDFASLNSDAKKLYVRLASRSKELFILSKLNYEEINFKKAFKDSNKFFTLNPKAVDEEELNRIVTSEILKNFLKELGEKPSAYKGRDALWERVQQDFDLFYLYVLREEGIIQNHYQEIYDRLLFLFFGNFSQSLSDFILEEVGAIKYPKYKISNETRIFHKRSDIRKGYELGILQEEQYLCREDRDVDGVKENLHLLKSLGKVSPRFDRKKRRLFNLGARFLESHYCNDQELELALEFHKKAQILDSRERRVRILYKIEEYENAYAEFKKIEENPRTFKDILFIKNFHNKFHKPLGIEKLRPPKLDFKQIDLKVKNTGQRVEALALKEMERKGWKGFYCENLYWNALFALAFWDCWFCSVDGAFAHPFQRRPLDLFDEDFFDKRQKYVKRTFSILKDKKKFEDYMLKQYETKEGMVNPFFSWKGISKADFKTLLRVLSTDQLKGIYKGIMLNLKEAGKGFPDLVLYKKGEFILGEVKGPGDQLQTSQKYWIEKFNEIGIPFSLIRVEWK